MPARGEEIDGAKFRAVRLAARKTTQEVADAVGCSRWMVNAWERGDRGVSIEDVAKLEKFFGVSAATLGIGVPRRRRLGNR